MDYSPPRVGNPRPMRRFVAITGWPAVENSAGMPNIGKIGTPMNADQLFWRSSGQ
jgi:hypothetical protein